MVELTPNSLLASSNLQDSALASPPSGVSDVADDPAAPDGQWWSPVARGTAVMLRVGFPTPFQTLSGSQTFRLWVRHSAGTLSSRVTVSLYEDGVFVRVLLLEYEVTSSTGELVEAAWNASELSDPTGAGVEIVVQTVPGFGPIVGSMEQTEEVTAISSAGTLALVGTHASTLAADTVSAAATLALQATLASTTAVDTLASVGAVSGEAPVITNAGTISGTLTTGSTLSVTGFATTGSVLTTTYQWLRDGEDIGGATSATYVTTAEDVAFIQRETTVANGTGSDSDTTDAVLVAFDPAVLFVGETNAMWFDPSDGNEFFTNAGTTVATTHGQTIQQWNDKSGIGSRIGSQATSGARPALQIVSGKRSLLFTTNDNLALSTNATMGGVIIGCDPSGVNNTPTVGSLAGQYINVSSAGVYRYRATATATTSVASDVTLPQVASFNCEAPNATTTGDTYVWQNGIISTQSPQAKELITGIDQIGLRATTFYTGDIFGIIARATPFTDAERKSAQAWMAGKLWPLASDARMLVAEGVPISAEIEGTNDPSKPFVISHHGTGGKTLVTGYEGTVSGISDLVDEHGIFAFSPTFDGDRFSEDEYQFGGYPNGRRSAEWENSLVWSARRYLGEPDQACILFGHSAGAQYLSRVAAHAPCTNIDRYVIANPSTWVFPDTRDSPYGFGNLYANATLRDNARRAYLRLPLTVYLGEDDNFDNGDLDTSADAMLQGDNRLERGQNCYAAAEAAAAELGVILAWSIVIAPNTGHSGTDMLRASNVNEAFFGRFFSAPAVGININPPHGSWRATSLGMTTGKRDALLEAGYDTLRIWLNMPAMMAAAVGAPLNAAVADAITKISSAVDDGFNAVVAYDYSWEQRLATMVVGSAEYTKFLTVNSTLAAAIEANIDMHRVVLQFHNEPPRPSDTPSPTYYDYSTQFAPAVWAAIRAAAPDLTICVSAAELAWAGALEDLDVADYDDNTMYAFHFYNPGEMTHHHSNANSVWLPLMPWPITDYPGGEAAIVSAMEALVDADGSVVDKPAKKAEMTTLIEYLWDWGGTQLLVDEEFDAAETFATTNSIQMSRIICTEFGFIGEHHWDGPTGYDNLDTRANFEEAVRTAAENRGFGWVVYQCMGDFNHFEQTDATTSTDVLIPELTAALGLTS